MQPDGRSSLSCHHQQIIDRIHHEGAGSSQQRLRTADHTNRRRVPVGLTRKHHHRIRIRNEYLVVNRVDVKAIGPMQLGRRPLDDTNWRLFAVSPSAEGQDALRKLIGHDDLVVQVIEPNIVHRSGQERALPRDLSHRWLEVLRQPGEGRDLRMGHSVGHQ